MRPPADEPAIETPIVLIILILVVATLIFFGVRYEMKMQAHKKREAAYQASLGSYTHIFRPGVSRKDVEDYLHGKNVEFRRMCCVDAMELSKRNSWDDLIIIGKEDAPWFCGEHNVYLAFQFIDRGQHGTGWDANDLDTLKAISVYHWLEGCL